MLTVVIPTLDSERVLVPALAALVPGSSEGLVREVILADGGSRDGTAKIADAAGCVFLPGPPDRTTRLAAAARVARGDWLLFLEPACMLEEGWTREVGRFIEAAERERSAEPPAGTFRLAVEREGLAPRVREWSAVLRLALTGRACAEQGLLIARRVYARRGRPAGRVAALRSRAILADIVDSVK